MRIRTIKPEFWKSERMCGVSARAKLLALGLLNYADDEGYFLAHPSLIRGELMPFAESTAGIAEMLQELVEIEYLRIGEDEKKRKIGLVVNFKKHQLVNRPQRSKLAGLVGFPEWSPKLPGLLNDGAMKYAGGFRDDSVNVQGAITAGMDQGMDQGMEGIREGSGEPSPSFALRAPEGDASLAAPLAESSMPKPETRECNAECVEAEAANGQGGSDSVSPDPAESAKKKKGGGADPEVGHKKAQKGAKKEEGPEFPPDLPTSYREPLTVWWHHKREKRQGYTKAGWLMLVRQQQRFPAEMVKASVEQSMTKPWAGLFTEKLGEERSSLGQAVGAKKGGGAAGTAMPEPARPERHQEPEGWREVWAELYAFPPPESWRKVPNSNRGDVEAALRKRGGARGFECPVPCDWRVVWEEIYGPLPAPETWEGVLDVARRQIVARIEANKGGKAR